MLDKNYQERSYDDDVVDNHYLQVVARTRNITDLMIKKLIIYWLLDNYQRSYDQGTHYLQVVGQEISQIITEDQRYYDQETHYLHEVGQELSKRSNDVDVVDNHYLLVIGVNIGKCLTMMGWVAKSMFYIRTNLQ